MRKSSFSKDIKEGEMGKINSCWSESPNDSIRGQERLSFPALMDGRPREFDLCCDMACNLCIEVDMPGEPERVRRWVIHNPGAIVKRISIRV